MSSTQTPQRGTGRGIGIRTAAGSDERAHGQLHVYDGDGKGKSQAALGVVLRTIGLGICEQKRTRVLLLRFLKGPGRAYDEDAAIEALQQGFPHLIDQVRTGRGDFFSAEEATRFDRQEAQRGWDIAKGAMASSVNLLKAVQELEAAGMTELAKKYSETIDILKVIHNGNHDSGPLNLAVQFGLISEAEIPQVMSLAQYAGVKKFNIDDTNLSKNLKKLYKDRTADDISKVVPLNHLVSSIAYKVCNEINTKTNFSEAAADILNNSAFVQMYTEATKSKDGQFIIQGFRTIWPSKLFTQVTLEAQKSYSSTSSSAGKLVFNINKEPKAVANTEKASTTDAPGDSEAGEMVDNMGADELDAVSNKRLTGPGARAAKAKSEPKMSADVLGRERRSR